MLLSTKWLRGTGRVPFCSGLLGVVWRWVFAGAWASLLACGCTPHTAVPRATVSGNVTVDHQPLEVGSIAFYPVEGTRGPSTGGNIQNGKYRIGLEKGVVVGRNRVEIQGFRKTGNRVRESPMRDELVDEKVPLIRAEYNRQSTLVRDIKQGDNQLDFSLEGDSAN